jgi:predicted small secreted protein
LKTSERGKDWVAIILAVGIAVALNCIAVGVLYDAIFSEVGGLSENATQILTGAFGGILGVLGSYIGYSVAVRNQQSIDQPGADAVESNPEATASDRPQPPSEKPHPDES